MTSDNTPRQCRILIVDDQESIHEAFRRTLAEHEALDNGISELEAELFGSTPASSAKKPTQFELDFAFQGEEAYEKVLDASEQGTPFSMAFVDMRMPPGWDGVETIEQLWKVSPDLQVVICTAYSDYSWQDVIERLGQSDRLLLLKKPFANEEVQQLANSLTEKYHLREVTVQQLKSLRETNHRLRAEIDQRKSAEDLLKHDALHDRLTQLPNRTLLTERILLCLQKKKRNPSHVAALMFLDVDNFKFINDSLGHSVGDDLLVEIANTLRECCRCTDEVEEPAPVAARLGGDEFVIFLEDLSHPHDAARVADRVRAALSMGSNIQGHNIIVGSSIGIAIVDDSIKSPDDLLRNADLAMYRAKSAGKNRYAIFDQTMHEMVLARLELETDLRRAIAEDQFVLHYQPILDLATGVMVGVESLVRWEHPERGMIAPDDFIPLAEETGLILAIGSWVIWEACHTVGRWNTRLPASQQLSVSINVAKRQILEPGFVDDFHQSIQETGISTSHVNLEITESLIMDNPREITDRLNEIKELGTHIHMDDFGTGHSSLSCLHRFPIDILKIDRSFVATMKAESDYAAIINAIITLAHNLNSKVIAEGIETDEQLSALRALNCDLGQGYYFSRPLTKVALEETLFGDNLSPTKGMAFPGYESVHDLPVI